MNYKKLILVGFISAFVAILTSVMGVAGTIIGSVISSVLYNMLTEVLEKPVNKATFSTNFEWDVAYVFPLVVIALIQLLLIFALLAEFGILPSTFLNVYLSLQDFANNNLYRLLGVALIIISAYPLVLKPEFVKKEHGIIIAGVGLVFLARGFVDLGNRITAIYDVVFAKFDLPIAIIAFILLVFVIVKILNSARQSENDVNVSHQSGNDEIYTENHVRKSYQPPIQHNTNNAQKREGISVKRVRRVNKPRQNPQNNPNVRVDRVEGQKPQQGINRSSEKIHFESNDLLDEYKK
ncbi:MAG: hypothetical protein IJ287_00895 [Methanobrevibacter sp.]|nr:hypothetical protein [Methanobrevibacter sp.]